MATVAEINSDPAKKKALLADVDALLKKHNLAVSQKFAEVVANPHTRGITAAESTVVITITE